MPKKVSVLGALGLLGQHLLSRLAADPAFEVVSLHDRRHEESGIDGRGGHAWLAGPAGRALLGEMAVLPPDATAPGELLLSFLPNDTAEEVEAGHLARGARILTHCEYARLRVPLIVPGISTVSTKAETLLATPNCTTAMCSHPLGRLHAAHGIEAVHITTLQAISGTDLPGMPAHLIHDQVVADLPGEADALRKELSVLFDNAFDVTCVATRVPVWRGHTISMAIRLADGAGAAEAGAALSGDPAIRLASPASRFPAGRDRFDDPETLCTIGGLRDGAGGWITLSLRGDNLEAATTGLMQSAARLL